MKGGRGYVLKGTK
jgi:hypothetical protein